MEGELRTIRATKKSIKARLMSDEVIAGELLKDINAEYNDLAEHEKRKESEIAQLHIEQEERSKVKEVSTRLSAIVNEIMKAGFSSFSFEEKREFLLTLYPFRSDEYHIKVWREGKKEFYWEAKGKFSEETMRLMFSLIKKILKTRLSSALPEIFVLLMIYLQLTLNLTHVWLKEMSFFFLINCIIQWILH